MCVFDCTHSQRVFRDEQVGYRFNTIGVSDGISMGTEGMSFSLQSRDLIADSIETVSLPLQRKPGRLTAALMRREGPLSRAYTGMAEAPTACDDFAAWSHFFRTRRFG